MSLQQMLEEKWKGEEDRPFLISAEGNLTFANLESGQVDLSSQVNPGDVVALIGDFNPISIATFIQLVDLNAIIMPLTKETAHEHEYFFESGFVNKVIREGVVTERSITSGHPLLDELKKKNHAGLILFSTGTTGRPKAILHDFTLFLRRFETPRPTFKTLNFLLFDHIGGLNTLFHTLFNKGTIISPAMRSVDCILDTCEKYAVEVLPTTPTFLRMLLMSGAIPDRISDSLKVISYGTERMDQPTLEQLCALLPKVDFRQTFGMSELGIVRVKSEARDSLYMRIGGEGIKTRVADNVLQIQAQNRMLGYLNAPSPFDEEGWYDTKDVVEEKNGYYRVTGRTTEVINVGGLKFMASEVERVALEFPGVSMAKATAKQNPITGQHVELQIQESDDHEISKEELQAFLKQRLQNHMMPRRIVIGAIAVGHRFKRA